MAGSSKVETQLLAKGPVYIGHNQWVPEWSSDKDSDGSKLHILELQSTLQASKKLTFHGPSRRKCIENLEGYCERENLELDSR